MTTATATPTYWHQYYN